MNVYQNLNHFEGNALLQTLYETSVNCHMFSINIHRNSMHIDQNAHFLTLHAKKVFLCILEVKSSNECDRGYILCVNRCLISVPFTDVEKLLLFSIHHIQR